MDVKFGGWITDPAYNKAITQPRIGIDETLYENDIIKVYRESNKIYVEGKPLKPNFNYEKGEQ